MKESELIKMIEILRCKASYITAIKA